MCNECKQRIQEIENAIGDDPDSFLRSHGFSNILHVLSYLLEKDRRGDKLGSKVGVVRPKDGHFEKVDAVSDLRVPAPHVDYRAPGEVA